MTGLNGRCGAARRDLRASFARMWLERHEKPRLLPNGVDWTDTRGSIRDNIRGQRAALAYEVASPHMVKWDTEGGV